MKHRDLVSSLVWMAVGGLFIVGALQQGLVRKGAPGPGFLPFFSGAGLIFVSLFVFIPALTQREKSRGGPFFPEQDSFRKLVWATIALFAFGFALEYVGYAVTTFFFMYFTARLMKPKGWRTSVLVALLTAGLSYLLFVVSLEVQLPQGLLGF